jgi:hypothetical protein
MNEKASPRWLMWTGPIFALLFLVGGMALDTDGPGEKASGAKVIKFFDAREGRGLISVFATPLLVALLILFAAGLRSRARRQGTSGVGATVMLAGAVLWSAGILLGSMLTLAIMSAADHNQPGVAQAANVIAAADWLPFIGGIAIFMIGAGLQVLASRVVPVWLGWVALVVGIVSLAGPGGFIGYILAPVWMLVVGILLAVRREDSASVEPQPASRPAPSVS